MINKKNIINVCGINNVDNYAVFRAQIQINNSIIKTKSQTKIYDKEV